jgi:ABC-type phosphate transport system substrate-binding protein
LNKSKSIIALFIVAMFAISIFAAIPARAQTGLLASGQLQVLGSSTVFPISSSAKSDFQTYTSTLSAPFASTTVTLNDLGSGAGLKALQSLPATADIAASSKSGLNAGLFNTVAPYGYPISGTGVNDPEEFMIGSDSIAIIVNSGNTWLTQLSASQVGDLFRSSGNSAQGGSNAPQYNTWGDWAAAQVPPVTLPSGWSTQTIVRIGRELSSGTWDGFNTFFMKAFSHEMSYQATGTFTGQTTSGSGTGQAVSNWLPANYQGLTANQDVLNAMKQSTNLYAIGFIGLGFVQNDVGSSHPDGVIPLNMYNPTTSTYVQPLIARVLDGTYVSNSATPAVIVRQLWYFMDGIPASNSADAVKSLWISYVKSNTAYITTNGYILMNRADMAGAPSGNPNTSVGTQTVPDGKVDFSDLVYFASAWIAYNSPAKTLNPYADITGPNGHPDGAIDFNDLVAFANGWIQANS